MYSYVNGNCNVSIHRDGTKIRECDGIPVPSHPESIDVKITNYCDAGCAFCHEQSTVKGLHGDLSLGANILSRLPAGVEIAIGGGNPLSHPDLIPFLSKLRSVGIIPNITVNQFHLERYQHIIKHILQEEMVFGLGISYSPGSLWQLEPFMHDNTVIHLIAGVHGYKELQEIAHHWPSAKVLLLGYKNFGRGKSYFNKFPKSVKENIYGWYTQLPRFFGSDLTISFDNLAIKQLNVRRLFTDEGWNSFYMGDDGQFTMYMDLVKKQYSVSSTSEKRWNVEGENIFDMFKKVRNA